MVAGGGSARADAYGAARPRETLPGTGDCALVKGTRGSRCAVRPGTWLRDAVQRSRDRRERELPPLRASAGRQGANRESWHAFQRDAGARMAGSAAAGRAYGGSPARIGNAARAVGGVAQGEGD